MALRKPLPIWIGACLFAVAATMTPLACRLLRQPVAPPRTLTELTALLSRCTPPLYVVRQFDERPEGGMWVCTNPHTREDLWGLLRGCEYVDRWRGIVFCERAGGMSVITEDFMRDNWGECGMQIGPLLFFGDPHLLQRIREAIFDQKGLKGEPYSSIFPRERGAVRDRSLPLQLSAVDAA